MDRNEFRTKLRGLSSVPSDKLYGISSLIKNIMSEYSWGRIANEDVLYFLDSLCDKIDGVAEEVESIEDSVL